MPYSQLPVTGFEKGGVVIDSNPFSLGSNEFSDVRNVRFGNRSVSKITGETVSFVTTMTPLSLVYWNQPTTAYYIYTAADGTTRRVTAGGTESEITKTGDPIITTGNINTSLFNGGYTYLVNDGTQVPQYISVDSNPARLADFPGWDYGTTFRDTTAGVVRPFQNVIVAGDLSTVRDSDSAVIRSPSRIRVSNFAARGGMPTWDPSVDSNAIAGEFELATNSRVIDMLPFQDSLFIYTEDSIFSLRLTGATPPINVQPVNSGRGMLSQNCGIELQGKHFVVGAEDIYLNGAGGAVESVADARTRDYFYNNLNYSALNRLFVIHNRVEDEVWVCYPKGTATSATEALVWNYEHNAWSIRDLAQVNAGDYGATEDNGSYSDAQRAIHFAGQQRAIIRADIGTSFLVPGSNTYSAGPINAYVERRGFDITPNDDEATVKVNGIYILASGEGSLQSSIRVYESPGKPIDFNSTSDRFVARRDYQLSGDMTDYKVDYNEDGRYFAIRLGSNDATGSWDLVRYNILYTLGQRR